MTNTQTTEREMTTQPIPENAGTIDRDWYSNCDSDEMVDWWIRATNHVDTEIDIDLSVWSGGRWLTQDEIDANCKLIDQGV